MEGIFVGDHVTYCSFSLSLPSFSCKNSNFPELSLRFGQFFKFPEFSRFVATLLQWQQQIICCRVNSDGLKVQLEKESYEND